MVKVEPVTVVVLGGNAMIASRPVLDSSLLEPLELKRRGLWKWCL